MIDNSRKENENGDHSKPQSESSDADQSVDAQCAASSWSQVSKRSSLKKTNLYWILGGGIAMGLVLMFSSPSQSRSLELNQEQVSDTGYSSSLSANLAHLKKLNEQKASQPLRVDIAEQPLTKHLSKEMLARQNAPTSMYANPISQNHQNGLTYASSNNVSIKENGQVREAVFDDQSANAAFANSERETTSVQAKKIAHPDFTIASGELLHAVLETSIDSDLPGMVRATVSKPAYAYTRTRTIIPAGSRLVGQYASSIVQGQNRVMVMWNRLILPNGVAVQLNSPGTDEMGRSGQGADSLNTHFMARFGESVLLSLIGAGAETAGVDSSDQYNSASQYRMAVAQSFQQSATQSLQGTLPMKPTIHIHQGASINVFVAHDLSFYNVLKGSA